LRLEAERVAALDFLLMDGIPDTKMAHLCRTQRWEAHIWQDGKQIYLGGFDEEEQAALAYDLAALKFRGPEAHINFDISNYKKELLTFNEVRQLRTPSASAA
jgi:hypothetical protein